MKLAFYRKYLLILVIFTITGLSIDAQTHISVPLDHPVYVMLDQAQMRGLCGILPKAKPYSRSQILSIIDEILANNEERRFGRLSESEREILAQFKESINPPREGLDLMRGNLSTEGEWNNIYFSGVLGIGLDFIFAGGYFPIAGGYVYDADDPNERFYQGAKHPASGDLFFDYTIIPSVSFMGDLGRNASYNFTINGIIIKSPRAILGIYDNMDESLSGTMYNEHREIPAFSDPLAYFPYAYKKRWDGFIWAATQVDNGGQLAWPNNLSIGYSMLPELSGSLLNGHVFLRFARLDREWAGMASNSSLVLNQSAQPFLALETVIMPFSWISISSLTGVLEYNNGFSFDNRADLKKASQTFQNAFSIVMLEVSYKNYFNIGLGSSSVWPKRFELGYIFPFIDNFLYQNNVGDFDNLALFLNIQGQYPGIGRLWFSLFLDEADPQNDFFEKDRMMYSFQFGGSFHIPWLPFASITLSYTKVEPYTYTHNRIPTPWYGDLLMETNYINFGKSLGHYIPPNSDEILVRFETIPFKKSVFSLQYQLIRHGADYGHRAVDGGSVWSELQTGNRDIFRKYFLKDGAYQWMHIVRIRGEYNFTSFKLPVSAFAEIGAVYSYFTDIEGEVNSSPGSYKIIDTPQYPHTLRFIAILGIKLFPKY